MKNIFKKRVNLFFSTIIIIILVIVIIVIACFYFIIDQTNTKLLQIIGGLLSGLVVAIVQFLFSIKDYRELEKIKALGVQRILPYRDDENFYRNFISSAKERIYVMGVTANRFMKDFADKESTRPEKQILINVLEKGVKVRILIPKESFLETKDKLNFQQARVLLEKTRESQNNFEYRYFDHIPTHSIVLVDNKCLLGPVFPNMASKDTPCIQFDSLNDYSYKYLTYFEHEWSKAQNE